MRRAIVYPRDYYNENLKFVKRKVTLDTFDNSCLDAATMTIPAQKGRPSTENGTHYYKMKDLVETTGIPKSTIILYVNKGLLPQPVRTSPNVAYYHPDCTQRIAFIKRIQSSHRLPLAAIKGLLKEIDRGKDVNALLDLQTLIFARDDDDRFDAQGLASETGLSPGQVEALVRTRLLVPLEEGSFDREDVAIGKLLHSGLKLGMRTEELDFYPKMADEIVEKELDLRLRHTRALSFDEDAVMTLEMTRIARGLRTYIIDRIMQRRLITYKGLKIE